MMAGAEKEGMVERLNGLLYSFVVLLARWLFTKVWILLLSYCGYWPLSHLLGTVKQMVDNGDGEGGRYPMVG